MISQATIFNRAPLKKRKLGLCKDASMKFVLSKPMCWSSLG